MGVVFLNRSRKQGSKGVVGPATGIKYVIRPEGTPVSEHDVDLLLDMTEPPCCGHTLPFDAEVKTFGVHIPTVRQLDAVPLNLWDAEPAMAIEEPKKKKRSYKKYEKPEEPEPELKFEEPEPVFEVEESKEEAFVDWEV